MHYSEAEAVRHAIATLLKYGREEADGVVDDYIADLYRPRPGLQRLFQQLQRARTNQKRGQVLEQITYLLFRGVAGVNSIMSYQSDGPQHDLVVSGDSLAWTVVCWLLGIDLSRRTIVVECKAEKSRVDHGKMARLAAVIEHDLAGSAGLGLFVTLKGATGYPTPKKKVTGLVAAREFQAIQLARTRIPLIVIDLADPRRRDDERLLRQSVRAERLRMERVSEDFVAYPEY